MEVGGGVCVCLSDWLCFDQCVFICIGISACLCACMLYDAL